MDQPIGSSASQKSTQADLQPRDLSGKFSKLDPPLLSFSITNPLTYIRKWWKAVMEKEGVDLRVKIHPVTAVMLVSIISGVSFGVGRFTVPEPVARYIPILGPSPTPQPSPSPNPWKDAAFVGTLQKQGDRFYLLGTDSQAVILQVPENVVLGKYVGRKILASGKYNQALQLLQVYEASDLEIISGSQPVVPISTPVATPH